MRILVKIGSPEDEVNRVGRETLERLKVEMPDVLLLVKNYVSDSVVVTAKWITQFCGMVSRFHIDGVLSVMELSGDNVVLGQVVSLNLEGGYFEVDVETPDGFVPREVEHEDIWDGWSCLECPLLADTEDMMRTVDAINVIEVGLRRSGIIAVSVIVAYLDILIESSRYDVSRETQEALKRIGELLEASSHPLLHDQVERFRIAVLDMDSPEREREFEERYFDRIYKSNDATDKFCIWYESFQNEHLTEYDTSNILYLQYGKVQKDLQRLPKGLYYKNLDDIGSLYRRLLGMSIPREKLMMLTSALVMRERLLDVSDGLAEEAEAAEQVKAGPDVLRTPEAMVLWQTAQENGWVDDRLQPTMSQGKAAILASVIADRLELSPCWPPFERLWGIRDLAVKFSKSHECKYYADAFKEYSSALG